MFSKIFDAMARRYQAHLGRTLREYGLKYEDLYNETYPEVIEALNRADPAIVEARNRRLARAGDVYMKGKTLPQHIQDAQDPFEPYLTPLIEQVQRELKEKKSINRNILS